jgi:diguanylate cyclase (GGDEF)-like protein
VLTGLPNRELFMVRLELALTRARMAKQKLGILVIDLDHFKRINDTMGHRVGDSMLRSVATRLGTALGANDTLYRVGGDEFIVLSETLRSKAQMEALAHNLLGRLQQPLELIDTEVVPNASIGIALYPHHSSNRHDLIKMADAAMFAAKSMGRNRCAMYQTEMTQSTERYLSLERALRKTLRDKRFQLHYQPQFDGRDGRLVGLEALLRWQHPERGLISAGEIIPVAENSNLIIELGEWVLREACRQLRSWLDQGLAPKRLAVNVSIRQLQDQVFVHTVDQALQDYTVPASLLELEITESCLQESEISLRNLKKLQELGLTIAIDDFGTGYSCMSSLKNLPIHCLKIDQSFVRGLPQDENDAAIVSAIIALGHQLKLKIIAEGIETPAQASFLRDAGCDEFQGYLLGHPMSAEMVTGLLDGAATDHPATGHGD